jgi:sugar phosphate isomerase/epimerase
MKIGLLTVLYADQPLEAVLDRVAALGLDAVELGTGNYPGDAHCPATALVADPPAARALRDAVAARGLTISALSCHGNPLHPDPAIAQAHHATWEDTLRLAELLEVEVVNTFSGCPGDGPDARYPNWVTCAWPPDFEALLKWQWEERVIPYWSAAAEAAGRHGVTGIGLEMHPGFVVYNPETLLALRAAAGERIGANYDPSHLVWQGIDPVVAVRELTGAIVHAHAKDTFVDAQNVRRNGVLDTKPYDRVADRAWTFRTVGYGHGESVWRDIVSALRVAGYDGTLSIEHEDILASRDEGLRRAVELLDRVVLREPAGEMWWS